MKEKGNRKWCFSVCITKYYQMILLSKYRFPQTLERRHLWADHVSAAKMGDESVQMLHSPLPFSPSLAVLIQLVCALYNTFSAWNQCSDASTDKKQISLCVCLINLNKIHLPMRVAAMLVSEVGAGDVFLSFRAGNLTLYSLKQVQMKSTKTPRLFVLFVDWNGGKTRKNYDMIWPFKEAKTVSLVENTSSSILRYVHRPEPAHSQNCSPVNLA